MISSRDITEIWKDSRVAFRIVRCDLLTEEIMSENRSNPDLIKLSRPAAIGEADAFLSHSWHDCPKAKWAAFQQWRAQFKAQNSREPEIWFDRVCLDQADIARSVQCLPVFLSGCQQLLILAGKTYLSRLWCVAELFVFITMGGRIQDMVIRTLTEVDGESVDLGRDIEMFDARTATCTRAEDRDRLLTCLEAGFGDIDDFSHEVRRFMEQAIATV